tara:strand:+ start:1098 stop:2939 length:1842 start_codon:yes stop_codon:yes gene_type:complete
MAQQQHIITIEEQDYLVEGDGGRDWATDIAQRNHSSLKWNNMDRAGNPVSPAAEARMQQRSGDRYAYEQQPWWQRFSEAVSKPIREEGYGIQELAGFPLSQQQQQRLDTAENRVHGGVGMVGELAGDLAMFAMPSKILKAPGYLAAAPTRISNFLRGIKQPRRPSARPRGMGFKEDLFTAAGIEGIKAQPEGNSRGDGIVSSILGSGVFGALGAVAEPAIKGIAKSDAARRLLDRFDLENLTPGNISPTGGVISNYEETLFRSPLTKGRILPLKKEAMAEMNDQLRLRLADELGIAEALPSGREAWEVMRKNISKKYDEIYDQNYDIPTINITRYRTLLNDSLVAKKAQQLQGGADDPQIPILENTLRELDNRLAPPPSSPNSTGWLQVLEPQAPEVNINGRLVKDMADDFQLQIDALFKNGSYTKGDLAALEAARDGAIDLLPLNVQETIKPLNIINREFIILRNAAGKNTDGIITPINLKNTLIADSTSQSIAEGSERITQNVSDIVDVFEGADAPPPGNISSAIGSLPVWMTTPIGSTSPAARSIITGSTRPQQAATKIADILRLNERFIPVTPARAGSSVSAQQNLFGAGSPMYTDQELQSNPSLTPSE